MGILNKSLSGLSSLEKQILKDSVFLGKYKDRLLVFEFSKDVFSRIEDISSPLTKPSPEQLIRIPRSIERGYFGAASLITKESSMSLAFLNRKNISFLEPVLEHELVETDVVRQMFLRKSRSQWYYPKFGPKYLGKGGLYTLPLSHAIAMRAEGSVSGIIRKGSEQWHWRTNLIARILKEENIEGSLLPYASDWDQYRKGLFRSGYEPSLLKYEKNLTKYLSSIGPEKIFSEPLLPHLQNILSIIEEHGTSIIPGISESPGARITRHILDVPFDSPYSDHIKPESGIVNNIAKQFLKKYKKAPFIGGGLEPEFTLAKGLFSVTPYLPSGLGWVIAQETAGKELESMFGPMTKHKQMKVAEIMKEFPLKEGASALEKKTYQDKMRTTFNSWVTEKEGTNLTKYFSKHFPKDEIEPFVKSQMIRGTGSQLSNKVPLLESAMKRITSLLRIGDLGAVMREAMYLGQDPTQRIATVADRWTGTQSFSNHAFKGVPKIIRSSQDIQEGMAGDMDIGGQATKIVTTPSSELWSPTTRITKRGTGYDKPRIKIERSLPEVSPPLKSTFYKIRTTLKSKSFNAQDSRDTEEIFRRLNAFGVAY